MSAILHHNDGVEAIWAAPSGRSGHRLRGGRWWLAGAAGLAAAAGLLVLFRPWAIAPRSQTPAGLQPMGDAALTLHVARERGNVVSRLERGAHVRSGDRLGLFYTTERDGHLRVLYVQSDGEVAAAFPAPDASDRIVGGKEVALPAGIALDDGSGCEWLIALYSESPIDDDSMRQAIDEMIRRRSACELGEMPAATHETWAVTAFSMRWE